MAQSGLGEGVIFLALKIKAFRITDQNSTVLWDACIGESVMEGSGFGEITHEIDVHER